MEHQTGSVTDCKNGEASKLYRTLPGTNDLVATLNEIADHEEDARELY